MACADDPIKTETLDVSGLSLGQLRAYEGTALGEAVRRVLAESAAQGEAVAGFDSNMPPVEGSPS
ncbi:FxSxx-COOH cyclophane-containing RiPP peptide [Actinomadura syzygii]|uniref:FxSxx-COOH cyclophane-containing RiPP peptide n=1 Tax=Actinomadura syzygii TaxID=1427538 RepID=UPI0016525B38|nr:FxSxx-COOH cyclophane-containing RiPP peptide [Actinomadura syzygii]